MLVVVLELELLQNLFLDFKIKPSLNRSGLRQQRGGHILPQHLTLYSHSLTIVAVAQAAQAAQAGLVVQVVVPAAAQAGLVGLVVQVVVPAVAPEGRVVQVVCK